MSDQNLNQYQLDITGQNPDNKVFEESHTLIRQRNRALALTHGAFYTETLEIKHIDTGYILQKYIDYKVLQPYSTLIALTGQSVAGIILIHNSNIHQNLAVTYQTVGGDFAISSKSLEGYLNSISDQGTTFSWYNSLLDDQSFEGAAPKLDTFDFHWLCFTLEKIRNAIIWSDSQYYEKIREYLNSVLTSIEAQTKLSLDYYLDEQFSNFKASVTKLSLGLNNLNNIGTASSLESIEIAQKDTRVNQFEFNKYITLQNLALFKETLYEKFALSSNTNIGLNRGVSITPTIESILEMLNGAIFILESKASYAAKNIVYEGALYPLNSTINNEYSVLRIINNKNNRGGLFLYSERNGDGLYLVSHSNGNPNTPLVFNKVITSDDIGKISQTIAEHLIDTDNPHKDTKELIGFKKLKNKPVVTREEVLSLQACSKYVTMDTLLLFAKTYMVDKTAAAQDPRNDDRDHVQIIYTAQAEDKCLPPDCPCPDVSPTPPPPVVIVPDAPLLVKLKQYINSTIKDNVVLGPLNTYSTLFDKTDVAFPDFSVFGEYGYPDGDGGYTNKFKQIIKNNSICAGYKEDSIDLNVVTSNLGVSYTPGINGFYVDKLQNFTPSLFLNTIHDDNIPDGDNREYVALIKAPGRVPHYIRGVVNGFSDCVLPSEFFGTAPWHTGSQFIDEDATYFALIEPYNEYRVKTYDENGSTNQITSNGNILVVKSRTQEDSYSEPPLPVYASLDTYVPTDILSGSMVIYNVPMFLDDNIAQVTTTIGFEINIELINGFGTNSANNTLIPNSFEYVPAGTVISSESVNNLGLGGYTHAFSVDISSLSPGKHVIIFTVYTDDNREGSSHTMQITKPQPVLGVVKTVPLFDNDAVEVGTIDISLNGDGTLAMTPFDGKLDISPAITSNVYFFEKSVTNGANPFVFVNDVYSDETENVKLRSTDVDNFVNENYFNIYKGGNFFSLYASIDVYNGLANTLDAFKRSQLRDDSNKFSNYTSVKTLTLNEFNSITKARVVPFRDTDYVCTTLPVPAIVEPPPVQ